LNVLELKEYIYDTASLFDLVADEVWAQYLDSGVSFEPSYGLIDSDIGLQQSSSNHKKHTVSKGVDILVCRPQSVLLTQNNETKHYSSKFSQQESAKDEKIQLTLLESSKKSPFGLLKSVLEKCFKEYAVDRDSLALHEPIPFWGGAIGYFGYELAKYIETLAEKSQEYIGVPEMAIGIYETAVISCHEKKRSWLVDISGKNQQLLDFWLEKIRIFSAQKDKQISIEQAWQPEGKLGLSYCQEEYVEKFERILKYIQEGDCYQVNLTNRFSIPVAGSSWQSYLKMRGLSSAPFGAYMNFPFAQVLSNSPERFIECVDQHVQTSPIKGTRPRDHWVSENDLALAEELKHSSKDRSENVMIVDLLRNDLGKVCEIGSVKVPKLFDIESFANVHHLVSHISGKLPENLHALDLLESCFPGGSITGAPKKRAMEIIEELEPKNRGVYCGAIGWIDFRGNMQTNIAIRTITHVDGKCYFSAGGGIVWESDMKSEYQELLDKAAIMLKTVGYEK